MPAVVLPATLWRRRNLPTLVISEIPDDPIPDPPQIDPVITSVSPMTMMGSGSAQTFTVMGVNFASNATLEFDPETGGVFTSVGGALTNVSSTRIDYELDNDNDAGTWLVRVVNPGQSSNWFSFTVVASAPAPTAPTITSISPPTMIGSNGPTQTMTITGTNFESGAQVEFDRVTGSDFDGNPTLTTFDSETQLRYELDNGDDAGTWFVRVNNPVSGISSNWFAFTINPSSGYFVDYSAGSDSNDGLSTSTPWKHCPGDTAATGVPLATVLMPGNVVRFKGGVTYTGRFTVSRSGTVGNPILYDGNHSGTWGTGRAVLDNNYSTAAGIKFNAAVKYVDVKGHHITNCGGYSDTDPILSQSTLVTNARGGTGIDAKAGGTEFITLENLMMERMGQWRNQSPFSVLGPQLSFGAITGSGIEFVNAKNCLIKDCDISKTHTCININSSTVSSGMTIQGCSLHYFVWGINVAPSANDATLTNFNLKYNTLFNYHMYDGGNWWQTGVGVDPPHTDGIFFHNDFDRTIWTLDTIRIHGNVFYEDTPANSAGGTASIYLSAGTSVIISCNVIKADKHGRCIALLFSARQLDKQVVRIYNNTCFNTGAIATAGETNTARREVHLVGNVLYRSYSVNNNPMAQVESGVKWKTCESNVYWNPQHNTEPTQYVQVITGAYVHLITGPWSLRTTYHFDLNGKYADPLLVDITGAPSTLDMHLQSGSPARGISQNLIAYVTEDADGNPMPATGPWDAGAYQFV